MRKKEKEKEKEKVQGKEKGKVQGKEREKEKEKVQGKEKGKGEGEGAGEGEGDGPGEGEWEGTGEEGEWRRERGDGERYESDFLYISRLALKGYRIKDRWSGRLESTDTSAIVCIAFAAAHRNSGRQYGGCEQFESCISYVGLIYHFG